MHVPAIPRGLLALVGRAVECTACMSEASLGVSVASSVGRVRCLVGKMGVLKDFGLLAPMLLLLMESWCGFGVVGVLESRSCLVDECYLSGVRQMNGCGWAILDIQIGSCCGLSFVHLIHFSPDVHSCFFLLMFHVSYDVPPGSGREILICGPVRRVFCPSWA